MKYHNTYVSYSKFYYRKKEISTYSLNEVFDIIKNDENIKLKCHMIKKAKNKNERTKLKKTLPVVVFQGEFTHLSKKGLLKHNGFALIDIDIYKSIEETLKIKEQIIKDKHVGFCFLSPSGGLKIGCKIPQVKDDHEYKEYYLSLIDYYKEYSIETDTQTKDISRLCYLSHDPNMYINENAEEYKEKKIIEKKKYNIKINDIKTDSKHIREALEYIKPDDREIWINICCALKTEGEEYFEMFNEWSSSSEKYKGESDCKKVWDSFEKIEDGITIGTLFYYAKKEGYKPKYKFRLDLSDINPEKQAIEIIDKTPMYYDNIKKWWAFDKDEKKWNEVDEVDIIGFIKKMFNLYGLSETKDRTTLLNALKDESRYRKPKPLSEYQIQIGKYIYNIRNEEKIEASEKFQPDIIINHEIDEVKDNEECPFIDKLFEDWVGGDKEVLYDIIAFCMSPIYFLDICFWLVGAGENGKGLFTAIINTVLGFENTTSQDLELLSDPKDRFTKGFLRNRLLCLLGDGNHQAMEHTKALKTLAGKTDRVRGEFKGGGQVDFFNRAKLLGAYNTLPETNDKTNGFYRRQHITEFKNSFCGMKNPLPDVPEREYTILAKKCFIRLKEMYKNNEIKGWGTIDERREKFNRLSNPIGLFINEHMVRDQHLCCFGTQIYKHYTAYAIKKGFNQFSYKDFEARLLNQGIEKRKKDIYTDGTYCFGKFEDFVKSLKHEMYEYTKLTVFIGINFKKIIEIEQKEQKEPESETVSLYEETV